jgi:uncharacterized protein YllA (UPF0747 family)
MTKAEEIQAFRDFYNSLPTNSYLKEILYGVPEEAEKLIRSDWSWSIAGSVRELQEEREQLKKEIRKKQEEVTELEKMIQKLEREKIYAHKCNKDIAKKIRDIAYMVEAI